VCGYTKVAMSRQLLNIGDIHLTFQLKQQIKNRILPFFTKVLYMVQTFENCSLLENRNFVTIFLG
jgi:hypothetical protein